MKRKVCTGSSKLTVNGPRSVWGQCPVCNKVFVGVKVGTPSVRHFLSAIG